MPIKRDRCTQQSRPSRLVGILNIMKISVPDKYGVIPNHILRDKRISLKAKGLWAYIQSKPDNWDFSAERIARECTDGKDGIRSGLKELEEF